MKMGTIAGVLGAAAAVVAIVASAPARAADLTPTGYAFSQPTECGSFCYHDTGGVELIDGVLGNAGWYINPGPWVGWRAENVDIDFDFGGLFTFSSVSVGTTQDAVTDVVLPSLDLYSSNDGVSWTLRGSIDTPANSANDVDANSTDPHGFLTFSTLNFTSRYVRLSAENMGTIPNTFTFIDEVDFTGAAFTGSPAPEPAAWLLMLVGFLGLGAMLRAGRDGMTAR